METVAGSLTHGEVSTHEVERRTGIPYNIVWVTLWRTPSMLSIQNSAPSWTTARLFCEAESICGVGFSKDGGR